MSFERALEHVLHHEGGYINHPSDPGGATNMGITLETLSEWRGKHVTINDVQRLTQKEAGEIYKAKYWDAVKGDEWSPGVALFLFDAAVNHGPRRAIMFAQKAAGVSDDGVIGPVTTAAIKRKNGYALVKDMAADRMFFYGSLRTFPTFGRGWSRRLIDTTATALELEDG